MELAEVERRSRDEITVCYSDTIAEIKRRREHTDHIMAECRSEAEVARGYKIGAVRLEEAFAAQRERFACDMNSFVEMESDRNVRRLDEVRAAEAAEAAAAAAILASRQPPPSSAPSELTGLIQFPMGSNTPCPGKPGGIESDYNAAFSGQGTTGISCSLSIGRRV
jgi:hypothetical protein